MNDDSVRSVDNHMSGYAQVVVQAGVISGGVHLGGPQRVVPHQLPARIGELVNQVRVLHELTAGTGGRPDLDDPRIKVVLGPRGSGKSTVATSWLHDCQTDYPDGQLYANLGAWTDDLAAPSEVLAEFMVSLGVNRADLPAGLAARSAMFRSLTHGLSLQVFLDDVMTPAQVRALLPGRGRSVVVATGQGAFGVLRRQGASLIDVDPLERDMAVELLRQFVGDRIDDDAVALDSLLQRCAGLPVALCQVGTLLANDDTQSMAELVDELAADTGGLGAVEVAGHPSLSALFDASYQRLSAPAQLFYRVIGVHPAVADLGTHVLAAAAGESAPRVRSGVRDLTTLRVVEQPRRDRLVVHTLIHEHARNLAAAVEGDATVATMIDRILAWYVAGAVTSDAAIMPQRPWRAQLFPDLVADPEHPAARDPRGWLELERANLRAVVTLAFEHGRAETVLQLCLMLWSLYEPGKYGDDLLATHALGVRAARATEAHLAHAILLVQMGFAYRDGGDFEAAARVCDEAMQIAHALDDLAAEGTAVECAGLAEFERGDMAAAGRSLRRNLEIARALDDRRRLALAQLHLAKTEQPRVALELLDQAMVGFRELSTPEPRNIAKIRLWQGRKLAEAGDIDEAREALLIALGITSDHHWPFDQALVLETLADVVPAEEAPDYLTRALAIYEENGYVLAAARLRQRGSTPR